jgi:hypothetical protein
MINKYKMNKFELIYESLLKEEQNIVVDKNKILNYIKSNDLKDLQEYLYSRIRSPERSEQEALDIYNSVTPKVRAAYNTMISAAHSGNAGWAQWDIQKSLNKTGNNFKLYYSPNNNDIAKFLQGLRELYINLQPLGQQSNLSFKIPTSAAGFCNENDKLVIHFSNRDIKDDVDGVVQNWAQKYGITLGKRTHTFGQDVGKESFGQRIAKSVVDSLAQHIQSNKYTPEQLSQWVYNSFYQQLKNIQ